MAYKMSPHSPRRAAAIKLGKRLARLLEERHVSRRGLALHLGTSRSLLQLWIRGDVLPSLENAARLSEALADDELLAIVKAARVGRCPCGRDFLIDGGNRRRYCSAACQRTEQKVRDGVLPKRDTLARQLEVYRQAIDGYCRSCEPEGLCRTADCPLRDVSPLPLVRPVDVDVAEPWVQGQPDPETKSAVMRSAWSRLSPAERRARVEAVRRGRWGAREALTERTAGG